MKRNDWFKEITKFILLLVITAGLFILAKFVFEDTHFASALFGASGGVGGLLIFQLARLLSFARNPSKFNKEQIDVEDERNILIMTNARSSAFSIETSVILGISMYAIYSNDLGFVLAIFFLWISRILLFFYYLSKNNKEL